MSTTLSTINSEPLVLVFGSDDKYSQPLAVSIYSSLINIVTDRDIYLYLIDGGMTEKNKSRISELILSVNPKCHFHFVKPKIDHLKNLKVGGHVTFSTFFSLIVPEVVDDTFRRAIFLDADILVQKNIELLFQLDIENYSLLAVQDYLIPYVSFPGGLKNYRELGFSAKTPYFNAGVLVYNLEKWRSHKIGKRVINYLQNNQNKLTFRDQEGLNALLAKDWKPLNPKWNVPLAIFSYHRWPNSEFKKSIRPNVSDIINDSFIWHFTGPNKPWNLKSQHPAKIKWIKYVQEIYLHSGKDHIMKQISNAKIERISPKDFNSSEPKATIIVLTHNRQDFLKKCLISLLKQDFYDFEILVLDDASTDFTYKIVDSLNDKKIKYYHFQKNLGYFGNWKRAMSLRKNKYFCILSDDSILEPNFFSQSILSLDQNPKAAFSFSRTSYFDIKSGASHFEIAPSFCAGLMPGCDFLRILITLSNWSPHHSGVVIRSSALERVKPFDFFHSKQLVDLSLYIRLASIFDVVFIDKSYSTVYLHSDQCKNYEFSLVEGIREISFISELIDASSYLAKSQLFNDIKNREWLSKSILRLNKRRGFITRQLFPLLNVNYFDDLQRYEEIISQILPKGEKIILLDENIKFAEIFAGCNAIPFPSRNGLYWGLPQSDKFAISELEILRNSGIAFMIFTEPSFWWFSHYKVFCNYLDKTYKIIFKNDDLIVFDLRKKLKPSYLRLQ